MKAMSQFLRMNRRNWIFGTVALTGSVVSHRRSFGQSPRGLIGGRPGPPSSLPSGRERAQSPLDIESQSRLRFEAPKQSRWKIGLTLTAPSTCVSVLATFVIPVQWPGQEVDVVSKPTDPAIRNWTTRVLPGGATQVVMTLPKVTAGAKIE